MVTVQQVFDTAIHLMDEQFELTGQTMTEDTNEYKFRTINVLNSIMPSLYQYSDTEKEPGAGKRPLCPLLVVPEEYNKPDFTQYIPLDDTLAMGVLPYALAGHLLATENDSLSAFFMGRYAQIFGDIRADTPEEFKPISMPYGMF